MTDTVDLLDLVRRRVPVPAERLRGLDGAWRTTEQAISRELSADPRAARRLVASFVRLAEVSGEREALGRAARLNGSQLWTTGSYVASARAYRRAVRMLDGAARDGARLGLAGALLRCSDFRGAKQLCETVRRAASRRGDALIAASADLNRGVASHDAGDVAAALAPYRRALAAFRASGDLRHAALAAQNLALSLALLDRFDESAPLYEEAAAGFESLGLAHEGARLRYNRGALLVAQDRLGDAERMLADAERRLSAAGDRLGASLARLDRGEALLRAGLVAEATRVLDSAARGLAGEAPVNEKFRAKWLRARAAALRGDHAAVPRILGRRPVAAERAWRADRDEIAGLALAGQRRYGAARRALARAAAAYGASRPASRARAETTAGWCAFEDADLAAARRHASTAAKTAERLGLPNLVHGAAALRFMTEDAAGDRRAAAKSLRTALASLERARDDLGSQAMRAAVLRGRERWFARAVRHVLDGPRGAERALALVERWRARALVELASSAARIEDEGERLAALRERVAVLERRLEGGVAAAFLRSDAPAAPSRTARALAGAERRLESAVLRALPSPDGARPAADRLRASVPPGAALVSLFGDAWGSLAFVVTHENVRAVPLGITADALRGLVEELHFRLGKFGFGAAYVAGHRRRLDAEIDGILRALGDAALGPLASALDGVERLIVAPHGAWHQVPLAAVPFRGTRLVESMTVASTPSLAALTDDVPDADGRPLVVAVADGRAPTIADEGLAVAASARDADHLAGEAATCAALAAARRPRFLHVAAHGRFRSDAPAMSGVRLADGWLRAVDFHSLDLAGSLVVLSGCETGVAHVGAGGEVEGLVRGVLASGAADLVVSLWRVDDAATARLMTRFHEELASGTGPAASLASAQREAAASGFAPWHWAGFGHWTRRLPRPR